MVLLKLMLVCWGIVACFAGYIAHTKNRSFVNWFLLTCVFGFLAFIAVCAVSKREIKPRANTATGCITC